MDKRDAIQRQGWGLLFVVMLSLIAFSAYLVWSAPEPAVDDWKCTPEMVAGGMDCLDIRFD